MEEESCEESDGSDDDYHLGSSPKGYHQMYSRTSLIDKSIPEYHRYLYHLLGPHADYFLYPKVEDTEKKRSTVKLNPKLQDQGGMYMADLPTVTFYGTVPEKCLAHKRT